MCHAVQCVAVMVWRGSATHPSNCTRLWCSKYPHSRNIFLGKLKCVAQAQTTGRLIRSKAFAESKTRALQLFDLFLLPDICTSPSPTRFPKLFAVLLRCVHPWHPNQYDTCSAISSPGALRRSHQRTIVGISAIGCSLVKFFGIKKNIVVQACCGHFPLGSTFLTFSKNSTTSSRVFFVKSNGTFG